MRARGRSISRALSRGMSRGMSSVFGSRRLCLRSQTTDEADGDGLHTSFPEAPQNTTDAPPPEPALPNCAGAAAARDDHSPEVHPEVGANRDPNCQEETGNAFEEHATRDVWMLALVICEIVLLDEVHEQPAYRDQRWEATRSGLLPDENDWVRLMPLFKGSRPEEYERQLLHWCAIPQSRGVHALHPSHIMISAVPQPNRHEECVHGQRMDVVLAPSPCATDTPLARQTNMTEVGESTLDIVTPTKHVWHARRTGTGRGSTFEERCTCLQICVIECTAR